MPGSSPGSNADAGRSTGSSTARSTSSAGRCDLSQRRAQGAGESPGAGTSGSSLPSGVAEGSDVPLLSGSLLGDSGVGDSLCGDLLSGVSVFLGSSSGVADG